MIDNVRYFYPDNKVADDNNPIPIHTFDGCTKTRIDYIWAQDLPSYQLVNVFNEPISEYTDNDHLLLGVHINITNFIRNNYLHLQYNPLLDSDKHDQSNGPKFDYDKINKEHWIDFQKTLSTIITPITTGSISTIDKLELLIDSALQNQIHYLDKSRRTPYLLITQKRT